MKTDNACIVPVLSLCAAVLSLQPAGAGASGTVPEPQGYRMDDYRTPVPATLRGATVVDADELHALLKSDGGKVALIDVFPLHPKPIDLPADRLWRPPTRYNLPGSVWLPNVGYGTISPQYKEFLVAHLKKLSAGEEQRRLVFYCAADCWMSWNAAKRALELGFGNIYWFPGGTDEWEFLGYELTTAEAEKIPREEPEHERE